MNDSKELIPVSPEPLAREQIYYGDREPFIEQPRLRDYWEVIYKRRWMIVTVVLVAAVLTLLVSLRTTPIYRAAARVEVESEKHQNQQLIMEEVAQFNELTFLQTQVQLISSDNLAWMTIQAVGLDRQSSFADDLPPVADADRRKAILIEAFKGRLKVELVRDSRIIELSFDDTDPSRAAAAVNALARNYVEYNFRKKYESTAQATEWMTKELDTLRAKVEKSQQALVSYESANAAVNIDDKQNITLQKLSELTRQLTDAQGDRIQKESLYRMALAREKVPSVLQSELLTRLRERQAELQDQYAGTRSQYGDNWPGVVSLKNRVAEVTRQMEQEERRLISRLHSDYLTATNREAELRKAVDKQKDEATRLNQLGIQFAILKREAEANQNLYNLLLQRMKEAGVSAGLSASNIHVVDQALPPLLPIVPRPFRNLAISIVVGLILGITGAFVKEYMDNTVKTPDHIERWTGMAALAVIPLGGTEILPRNRGLLGSGNGGSDNLLLVKHGDSAFAEAIRRLRTSFLLSLVPEPPRVVVVTSGLPREGKTTLTVNLALALAQQGRRVLLLDGDLRRPGLHQLLNITNVQGLSSILAAGRDIEPRPPDGIPNLFVLTAGGPLANPADALGSAAMSELLLRYREQYDHVLIDTPPMFHFTDAVVVGHMADGVLLVAKAGAIAGEVLRRAYRTFTETHCRVLGTILNMVDFKSEPYYYAPYYGDYYRKYYSHREKPTKS
jgi:capsular exopolysaccharide synthesis family protein